MLFGVVSFEEVELLLGVGMMAQGWKKMEPLLRSRCGVSLEEVELLEGLLG